MQLSAQKAATQSEYEMIDQVYKLFSNAYKFKNADMFLHLYTEDCLYLKANKETGIIGQSEAVESFAEMFEKGSKEGLKYDIEFRFVNREVMEATAFDAGYYRMTTISYEGEPSYNYGKFLMILKKGDDSIWRIFADSYSGTTEEIYLSGK